MKKLFVGALSMAVIFSLSPELGSAQSKCPAEVAQAKEMLSKSKKMASVKPDDVQAPRVLAGARGNQDVQSPRGNQNVQSPRENQNVQSPRGNQDVQSPRGNQNVQSPRENQNVQSPRAGQDVQAPRTPAGATAAAPPSTADITKAGALVKQAEAACKSGNMTLAAEKAKDAMALLKQ